MLVSLFSAEKSITTEKFSPYRKHSRVSILHGINLNKFELMVFIRTRSIFTFVSSAFDLYGARYLFWFTIFFITIVSALV